MLDNNINKFLTWIFIISLTIIALGIVIVSSSSVAISEQERGNFNHYTREHLWSIFLGVSIAYIISLIGINVLRRYALVFVIIGVLLSVLVFIPDFSVSVNGASRWLKLSFLRFQPYDLFKLSYILFLAHAVERYYVHRQRYNLNVAIAVLITISTVLILQPDFGSFFLLLSVVLLMVMLTVGINSMFIYTVMVMIVAFLLLVILEPYRQQRIATFFNPWSDRYGAGFQIIQAMIAEGEGGITGIGLGKSIQKMLYLPEAHTDFSISIFAEEVGMIGVIIVICLFTALFILLMFLSSKLRINEYLFESYVVFLIANFIFLQFVFNICVNYNLLPTKGITLPFMGYGGTSVVSHIAMIGMVMSLRKIPYKKTRKLPCQTGTKNANCVLAI